MKKQKKFDQNGRTTKQRRANLWIMSLVISYMKRTEEDQQKEVEPELEDIRCRLMSIRLINVRSGCHTSLIHLRLYMSS
ncbi:hypothetical protein M514_28604 [Trichuris suis]|uniref:Uncharacterized protein n=1 Tax=Trichuris suis TaxID=68888 RepID=A0A085MPS1_9BILA|nr:hypothetical protein M513_14258 [Trichuris suis]KFD57401.1 hypothetical protein M513_01912 [Trichuris suis]KFD59217.1 hypothetical protein M514_28604 [Trichuris suis]KHJ46285.1 hypothetical protein D918_03333 [Trichuris suis]